jgi:hypothetical protein
VEPASLAQTQSDRTRSILMLCAETAHSCYVCTSLSPLRTPSKFPLVPVQPFSWPLSPHRAPRLQPQPRRADSHARRARSPICHQHAPARATEHPPVLRGRWGIAPGPPCASPSIFALLQRQEMAVDMGEGDLLRRPAVVPKRFVPWSCPPRRHHRCLWALQTASPRRHGPP